MRKFDDGFREALRESIEKIESVSGAEVVATVMPRARRYRHIYLLCGIIPAMIIYTIMMFVEAEYWYVMIYWETIGTLIFGALLPWAIPGLTRLLVGQKQLQENAETEARALFQRAGIIETVDRIGILIVYVWYEKVAVVLVDSGAEELIPPDELELISQHATAAIRERDAAQGILDHLETLPPVLQKYIPRDVHDINELPDELWLH